MKDFPFLEQKNCEICNSNKNSIVYKWEPCHYNHSQYETCSWDGRQNIPLKIVKCSECGFVYSKPSFKEEYLHLIYPENFIPTNIDIKELSKSKKWNSIIANIKRLLPEKSVIFDIGTRYGVLPRQLFDLNYNAFGIEYNPQSVKIANKVINNRIFQGTINDIKEIIAKQNIERINAFILDDVLEHLVHPSRDIKTLSDFQKKGDFLFLKQMNYNSLGRKLYRKNWYYFQPAAHMFYFNKKSIKNLLQKHNYKVIKIEQSTLFENLKFFILNLITNFSSKKHLSKFKVNNKINLLAKRKQLKDLFLVVAQKK